MVSSIDCLFVIQCEIFLVIGMMTVFFIETWVVLYFVLKLWVLFQPAFSDALLAGDGGVALPYYW